MKYLTNFFHAFARPESLFKAVACSAIPTIIIFSVVLTLQNLSFNLESISSLFGSYPMPTVGRALTEDESNFIFNLLQPIGSEKHSFAADLFKDSRNTLNFRNFNDNSIFWLGWDRSVTIPTKWDERGMPTAFVEIKDGFYLGNDNHLILSSEEDKKQIERLSYNIIVAQRSY